MQAMKEHPERKQIRLKGYDYSQCGYYFITVCTYERQHLFGEIVGATTQGRPYEKLWVGLKQ